MIAVERYVDADGSGLVILNIVGRELIPVDENFRVCRKHHACGREAPTDDAGGGVRTLSR